MAPLLPISERCLQLSNLIINSKTLQSILKFSEDILHLFSCFTRSINAVIIILSMPAICNHNKGCCIFAFTRWIIHFQVYFIFQWLLFVFSILSVRYSNGWRHFFLVLWQFSRGLSSHTCASRLETTAMRHSIEWRTGRVWTLHI